MKQLLVVILAVVALLGANSIYLAAITLLGEQYQTQFYLYMFLTHLVLGLGLMLPFLVFAVGHLRTAWGRPNRVAVRAGVFLLVASIVLIASGLVLVRFEGFEVKDPALRSAAYWAHAIAPLWAVGFYIRHRMAGPRMQWKLVGGWGGVVAGFVAVMAYAHQHPVEWGRVGPKEGARYFFPSAARTATGDFIPAHVLMADDYCKDCHADAYAQHYTAVHHFSSFNNPPYLFSVRETRRVGKARDGDVRASRWCAGCHDPVPFLSGAFELAKFDDPNYDLSQDEMANAGITCTVCHAVTHVNNVTGNAAFTFDEPKHYPFTFSDSALLRWVNRQLVKAKPSMHKRTFLKPFHRPRQADDPPDATRQAEFCSGCHKVSLPYALNHYKEWLRGQDHYGAFITSGVSGHGARSFYYPDLAKLGCAECHMPLARSGDFGAQDFDSKGGLKIHDHTFVGANTGLAALRGDTATVKKHQEFLRDMKLRIDLFGVKAGGTIEGELIAPIRPVIPTLKPGQRYLVEVVTRTMAMGHLFTQGTADSNEIWVDVEARSGSRVLGRSGALDAHDVVDPWSHFLNVRMLDKNGNRIDRRNPQDIFVPLYNHQIPPGAGQVAHYQLDVPPDITEPIQLTVKLQYRKFDRTYQDHFAGKGQGPKLPVTTICEDTVLFPVTAGPTPVAGPTQVPEWMRWNDYGIGLLLEGEFAGEKGELKQALAAFQKVAELGQADGFVNQARVHQKEGNVAAAVAALQAAAQHAKPAPPWVVSWLTGLVNAQNGYFEEAIANFESIVSDETHRAVRSRNFDFRRDPAVWTQLGVTQFELAKGEAKRRRLTEAAQWLDRSVASFERTLQIDPEDVAAHHNLALVFERLAGETGEAERGHGGSADGPETASNKPTSSHGKRASAAALTADALRDAARRLREPAAAGGDRARQARELARQVRRYLAAPREPFESRNGLLAELRQLVRPVYTESKPAARGDAESIAWLLATLHRELHGIYQPDPDARNRAVALHRAKNPAADRAAQAVVIYDLSRSLEPGLAGPPATPATVRAGAGGE
jgi:hypothetical protein